MEKDKVQEDIQVEKEAEIEEEEEAAGIEEEGRKRERKSGEGEGGSPTRKKRDPAATERKKQLVAEWHKNLMEETLKEMARFPEEDWSDRLAMEAREFRENWEFSWSPFFGPFEKTTPIPPVRFSNCTPVPGHASLHDSLQIFSVRIKELRRGLQWPIHVFGLIAARDTIDQNRIIVFNRTRDNCQTLTKEDRYLSLTGPTRAVVATDNVHLEAVLKVKGSIVSEDKDLSFLTVSLIRTFETVKTCLVNREYTSRLSTMELTFGYVVHSLEAAISVRVIDGLWQDGYRGLFAAHTFSLKDSKVVLLDCGYDEMVPVNADGRIGLSRHVVSVESKGDLTVSVMAFGCDDVKEDAKDFTPKDAGMRCDVLDVGFCKMEVTVAWSLISLVPHEYVAQCHSGGV